MVCFIAVIFFWVVLKIYHNPFRNSLFTQQRPGEWLITLKAISIKTHGRPAISTCRYGFEHLRSIVLNFQRQNDDFSTVLRFLSCT
jgi:hypothetical protein